MKFKTLLMDGVAVERAVKRISHEITERNNGVENVVEQLVPAKKAALKELNMKALSLGKNYNK
jgi:pyrimidine operon attenuation protein/uracil phosphoribosyltransferase